MQRFILYLDLHKTIYIMCTPNNIIIIIRIKHSKNSNRNNYFISIFELHNISLNIDSIRVIESNCFATVRVTYKPPIKLLYSVRERNIRLIGLEEMSQ